MKKGKLSGVLLWLVALLLGVGFGLYLGNYLYFYSKNILLDVGIIILAVIFFIILHVFIHEFGHFLFGKISGYRLDTIRFFSHAFLFKNNKMIYKKATMPGTLGQCLMLPPALNQEGRFPYKLYLMGGGLLNILTALIILGIVIASHATFLIAGIFIFVGLFLGITNLIPASHNDGMTLKLVWNNPIKEQQLYNQLLIYSEVMRGVPVSELPRSLFLIEEGKDKSDYFNNFFELLDYDIALSQFDFEKCRQVIEPFWQDRKKLIKVYQIAVSYEMLFILSVEKDEEATAVYRDPIIQKFLNVKMMGLKKGLAAYAFFIKDDMKKALSYCEQGKALYKVHPNKVEADVELRILEWIESEMEK